MRSFFYSLAGIVILLVAVCMQYLTLTYGPVVESFIKNAFGWTSLALAFIAGWAFTAFVAEEKP